MINLKDFGLLDKIPDRVTDEEMEALAYAIDPELQEVIAAISEVIIFPRIDQLPENLVDLLAWQLHVDFYDSLGFDLATKRTLVKNSLLWHRHKGTKYAVEEIVRTLFYDEFFIEEWFEYGGRPYFFRARMGASPMSEEELTEVRAAIDTVKNERSWLDYVIFHDEIEPHDMHIAGALGSVGIYEIFIADPPPSELTATIHIAPALDVYIVEHFTPPQPIIDLVAPSYVATIQEVQIMQDFVGTAPQNMEVKKYLAVAVDHYVKEEF